MGREDQHTLNKTCEQHFLQVYNLFILLYIVLAFFRMLGNISKKKTFVNSVCTKSYAVDFMVIGTTNYNSTQHTLRRKGKFKKVIRKT